MSSDSIPEAGCSTSASNISKVVEQTGNFANPVHVAKYLRLLQAQHPSSFSTAACDPVKLRWFAVLAEHSRFLSEEALRHPEWVLDLTDLERTLSKADYDQLLEDFLFKEGLLEAGAIELARFRRKELLRIAVRDFTKSAGLIEITSELSSLAESIISRALQEAEEDLAGRFGRPSTDESTVDPAVFTVLALGKLGGRELNYSSDVDLMFLYSANGETSGPIQITNKEYFKKLANSLTNLLSSYTSAGQCYRVDLRLRPEGTHGEVCISLAAALDYYRFRARDWELQMLLKARVVAGDLTLGQKLLDSVEDSIYSTTLDFSLVESMSETRQRIREKASNTSRSGNRIDVKLTRGGIRDIEFLTQCLQRLHGNRQSAVKGSSTLSALAKLRENDLLSSTEYVRLARAYEFLRNVEHVLQVEDDRQTHTLPASSGEFELVAQRILAVPSSETTSATASFLRELNQHLENVQAIYERIVHAQRPLYYNSTPPYEGPRDVPANTGETTQSVFTNELKERLSSKAPGILTRLHSASLRSQKNGLADFIEGLLQSPDDLQLFSEHPTVANWTIQLFDLSPLLAGELVRYPELLEEIQRAADYPDRRYAFEALAAPLTDIEGLRWFFRREMFRTQVVSICLPEPVFKTLDQTSALAEFVIARAYRVALELGLDHARRHASADDPFEEPQNELMVVALGRLGMREFDLGSDADLLFIIPDSEVVRQRFWTRVVERLLEILSGYSEGGPIVSIDTRLRPNGREGPLVQSESKFVDYFAHKAEAWEGIAYMKARGVAGDTDRATKFLTELQQVDWRRYGQGGRSKLDLRQMRARLQREQGAHAPLKAAQGGYYDADFILMYLRLRGAGMFFKSLNTPERINVVEQMGHLGRSDAAFLLGATNYFRALDHALRLVTGHVEGKIPSQSELCQMTAELLNRWVAKKTSAATLQSDLLALQTNMHSLFERVFE
jgi:[glutamine synthetase] adenylyltransferase / [glutamine synthetase]-adenylyl-L-tyrosine phosphorylase